MNYLSLLTINDSIKCHHLEMNYLTNYVIIGVINTAIHWIIFIKLNLSYGIDQGPANALGFFCAASTSYFLNSKFTFKKSISGPRYLLFIGFMGGLSYATGAVGDIMNFEAVYTAIIFTIISLAVGFSCSRYFIFRD